MSRNIALRAGLIAVVVMVAAVLFLTLGSDGEDRDTAPEITDEETSQPEYTQSVYGAAAQFPQGENPPVGVERTDAVSSDARIFLDEATRDGDAVTAFGRFTGGTPECVLLGASGEEVEGEMEVVRDTFLFTAKAVFESGNPIVRCTIAGRFFADGPPQEELEVR